MAEALGIADLKTYGGRFDVLHNQSNPSSFVLFLLNPLDRYLSHAEMILPMVEASGPAAINTIRYGLKVYKSRRVVHGLARSGCGR